MTSPTRMTIDGTGATPCTLELFVSGAMVTQFSYLGAVYTLPARTSPVNVPQADYSVNMRQITQWVGILQSLWPQITTPQEYEIRRKRSAVKCEFSLDFGGPKLIDAEKTHGLPYVTFKQRPAFTLNVSQFDLYRASLMDIMGWVF